MDKAVHFAELSPTYSSSICVSTKIRGDGRILYDDYAREAPMVPVAKNWQARSMSPTQFKSPLYIATCLASLIFVAQLGASLTDVPSIQLLEDIICRQVYPVSSATMLSDIQCRGANVQAELNIIAMGSLILRFLSGERDLRDRLLKPKIH